MPVCGYAELFDLLTIQYSVFSLFTLILTIMVKTKEQRKSNYMCTMYYFEIVRSGQRSRAFGLATTTVQLIIRGGYFQNIIDWDI